MRHRLVRMLLATAFLSGTSILAGGPAPVAADCAMEAPPRWISAYRGMAFVGTVTGEETVRLPHGEYTLLTIAIERSIAGDPADPVRILGGTRDTSCTHFRAGGFRVGDRLLLSFRPFDEPFDGRPEGVEVAWTALPWVPDPQGGWRFARRAVAFPESYPHAAVRADTLREIVAMVRPRGRRAVEAERSTDPVAAVGVPLLGDITALASRLMARGSDAGGR
jgi:hypothetical protein